MPPDSQDQRKLARRVRRAALIMALTFALWMAANFLGGRLGWNVYLAFAFDIAALIGLIWALYVAYEVHRARRDRRPPDGR